MTTLEAQLRGFHAAVTGAAPLDSATGLIVDDRVAAIDRLRVYAHAYTARIGDVLAFDYPKLDVALGSVRALTAPYLRAHPPAHPSLREVGAHLARFLAGRGEPAHLVDLARLERARTEAFDGGADVAPLRRADLATLGAEAFPALRLRLVPSSHVIALMSNADAVWDALEDGRPAPAPAPAARTVLVWRRDVTVVHRTLDPDEASAMPDLATGASFAEVCDRLAGYRAPAESVEPAGPAEPVERALALLLRWLDAEILSSG